jgi:hypothetical protein
MKLAIEFLKAIGHTDKVYIRCLPPKNTPQPELEARGMTYQDKSGVVKKSVINGFIDLRTGVFNRRYGDKYKPVSDGWSCIQTLNKQGYGVYFVVGHGGERNAEISHGSVLFHESDRASLKQQQLEIDRITQEFGKPTAVVQTKKSLHSYWASEIIRIDNLATYQRRWLQYSNCDDSSLADPSQLMRLPGFDHLTWNPETQDFDRVQCQLIQLNEVSYTLDDFDRVLPALDIDRWCQQSISDLIESDADDRDIRSLTPYLPGFDSSSKWGKAKCPAHDGESSDSLHIDSETGGFICHAGCSSSAVYNAVKALAVAAGHRFEVKNNNSDDLKRLLEGSRYDPIDSLPQTLKQLIKGESDRWSLPSLPYISVLLSVICSLTKVDTVLIIRETKGKPILWVGIVGTSNSGKSESMRTITAPLTALQRGANEEYDTELANYERDNAAYEKKKRSKSDEDIGDKPRQPACREYYVDDYTYESLASIYQYQKDKGLLLKLDELKAFCDFEKYGTANNRSRMLSLYDGDEMKCNRKNSGRIHIEKTNISLVGTTQYTTLSNIFAKDDNSEDGLWARLVFVNLPTTATYSHDPESNNKLYTELAQIYATINGFKSQTFGATTEAKELWTTWYNSIVDLTIANSGTFLESIYGKAKDRVARIALALHLLHAAANGKEPESDINEDTMLHAIALGRCLLLETEKALALTDANPTTNPEDDRILKFVTRFKGKGLVNTRMVTQWWKPESTRPNAQNTRAFMAKVVSLGYAIDNGEDVESTKYQIEIPRKSGNIGNKSPTPQLEKGLDGVASIGNTNNQQNTESHTHQQLRRVANVGQQNGQQEQHSKLPNDVDNLLPDVLPEVSNTSQTLVNNDPSDSGLDSVAKVGNRPKALLDKDSMGFVANVANFSKNLDLKIGDRVKLGEDIITIEKIEKDFIGGKSDDGSYIGGDRNSVELVSVDEFPVTQETTQFKTIDDGGIEYEC